VNDHVRCLNDRKVERVLRVGNIDEKISFYESDRVGERGSWVDETLRKRLSSRKPIEAQLVDSKFSQETIESSQEGW